MNEQVAGVVIEHIEKRGFHGVELGLAAVGAAATVYGVYSTGKSVRTTLKRLSGFTDELADGFTDISNSDEFKNVARYFGKKHGDNLNKAEKKAKEAEEATAKSK